MNVLSLFDGMSCGMLALDRAGISVDKYYASEVDKYAEQVSAVNYPDTVRLGDVQHINYDILPKIDLLIGGSPCQGFSLAGKGLNFADPRSALFFEFVHALHSVKPKHFLLENVRMKGTVRDEISKLMGCEPIEIDSSLVSAQSRKRLYWTNIPLTGQPKDKGVKLKQILESGYVDRDKSYCIDANYWKGGNLKSYFEKGRRQLVFLKEPPMNLEHRKLTPLECERLQTVPEGYTNYVSNTQRYKMLGNGGTIDVIAFILSGLTKGEH